MFPVNILLFYIYYIFISLYIGGEVTRTNFFPRKFLLQIFFARQYIFLDGGIKYNHVPALMLSPICLHSLDCVAKNCKNGGTQDPDTCDCVCPPEYTGPLCESEYDTL